MTLVDYNETGMAIAKATEAVARAVVTLSGKGKKDDADHVAVETMREVLNSLELNLHVHLGEGEKDNAPMLYTGERLGKNAGQGGDVFDLVVDPLECTTNFSRGLADSTSVIVASPEGSFQEIPGSYMDQIFISPMAGNCLEKDGLTIDSDPADVVRSVSSAIGCPVAELTVVVQDRPRHKELIEGIRKAGAGVSMIESGSISAALEILVNPGSRSQMLWGTFGAPEGLVLAAASNLGGNTFYGRIAPHNDTARAHAEELGMLNRILSGKEWVREPVILVVSGIHSSTWLRGVERAYADGKGNYKTHTIVWTPEKRMELIYRDGDFSEMILR